ncbi:MAG: cyclic nucleotide-binding domain-containing protein [Anaerolineae bacterium]
MAEITLERLLEIPLIQNLSQEQAQTLLPHVQEVFRSAGVTLFRQGDSPDYLYYVEEGQVAELAGDPADTVSLPRHAGPGSYLGRYAVVTGQPYQVTAIAEEDSTLLAIPLRHLQPLLFSYADWRRWFFQTETASRLRALPSFQHFSDWDIYRLADQVTVETYQAGETICSAGEEPDCLYLIDQGQVEEKPPATTVLPGVWPKFLSAGNLFGHRGLDGGRKRQVDRIARKDARLFRLSYRLVQELLDAGLLERETDLARVDIVGRLRGVRLFNQLDEDQLQLLAGYTSLEYHRPGDFVSRQGEPATSLMILDNGEAVVRRQIGQERPRPVSYFKARRGRDNDESVYFGDHALLADEQRGATVEVTEPSVWIVVERADFADFFQDAGLTKENLSLAPPQTQPGPPATDREIEQYLPYLVRRHWIVLVTNMLPPVGLIILAAVLIWSVAASDLTPDVRNLLEYGGLVSLVLLALWAVYRYVDWWNDTYEVTTQAVIHREKKLFYSEERYEIPLQQIQNVNILVSPLGQLLGYGDLSIDTAAARGQIDFTRIPEPSLVQELIQFASFQARSGQRMQFRESIRRQLEEQFYPERLDPAAPGSVLIRPDPPPPRPSSLDRFRSLSGWLPRFEIRENGRVTWRKHWLNLLQRTGLAFLAGLASAYLLFAYILAFVTAAFGFRPPVTLPPISWLGTSPWLFFLLLILSVLGFLWLIYQYVDWRNDIYIVTDNEVIDVERDLAVFPFFFLYSENRRQASLANVQYVDFRIPNPLAMAFNVGNVIVQTAGAEGTLTFDFVSRPKHVHEEILRRLAEYEERQRQREFSERWGDMAEWFEAYQNLNS